MPHNNPNLVPAVITDRNGKTTTVYRRTSSDRTAKRSMPAPRRSGKKPVDDLSNLRTEMLGSSPAKETEDAFNWVFSPTPELTELSSRLLTTGTATGQRLVREILFDAVGTARAAAKHFIGSSRTAKVPPAIINSGVLTGKIIRAWAYGNVREESGISPDEITGGDLGNLQYFHSIVTINESPYDDLSEEDYRTMSPATASYWRGLSAIAVAMEPGNLPDEIWDHASAFISWAAEQEDIATVIRVAAKHSNIDPEELPRLIEADDNGVGPALTDGWI